MNDIESTSETCPVCHKVLTPENTHLRKDSYGKHWCISCTTEFDNIDPDGK